MHQFKLWNQATWIKDAGVWSHRGTNTQSVEDSWHVGCLCSDLWKHSMYFSVCVCSVLFSRCIRCSHLVWQMTRQVNISKEAEVSKVSSCVRHAEEMDMQSQVLYIVYILRIYIFIHNNFVLYRWDDTCQPAHDWIIGLVTEVLTKLNQCLYKRVAGHWIGNIIFT